MREQIKIFLTALLFFTRIPVYKLFTYQEHYLNKSSQYFPLVGWIVGGVGALTFWGASFLFPPWVAVLLSTGVTILTTGAFHEDGFGDVCDAFGGGYTKERILDIMKDSRIGAYGTLGMTMILLTKIATLASLPVNLTAFTILAGHALSRFVSVTTLRTMEYVTENDKSKSKPLAKKMSKRALLLAGFFGIVPLAIFQQPLVFLAIIPVFIAQWGMNRYFKKWIGGYTGDCLGATQQVCEVVFYLFILALMGKVA